MVFKYKNSSIVQNLFFSTFFIFKDKFQGHSYKKRLIISNSISCIKKFNFCNISAIFLNFKVSISIMYVLSADLTAFISQQVSKHEWLRNLMIQSKEKLVMLIHVEKQ